MSCVLEAELHSISTPILNPPLSMVWVISHLIPFLRVLLLAVMLAFVLGALSELPAMLVALVAEIRGWF